MYENVEQHFRENVEQHFMSFHFTVSVFSILKWGRGVTQAVKTKTIRKWFTFNSKYLVFFQVFQKRLAFCTQRLETAKKCLRGGFTPVEDFIKQQKVLKMKAAATSVVGGYLILSWCPSGFYHWQKGSKCSSIKTLRPATVSRLLSRKKAIGFEGRVAIIHARVQ